METNQLTFEHICFKYKEMITSSLQIWMLLWRLAKLSVSWVLLVQGKQR